MGEATGREEASIVNITGDLVALGPVRRDLLALYQRWINDFSMLRTLGLVPIPTTAEQEAGAYDQHVQAVGERDIVFTIYERASGRAIGRAGLHEVDYRNSSATYSIFIGEADCRGKGYGTETTRLILDDAFTTLGLHNVMLTVVAFNAAGLRAYEKAGFREIGRRRQCRLVAGFLWDDVYMDCLASEFTPGSGPRIGPPPPIGHNKEGR
jgi:diamine N-acetyltransferase